MGIQENIIAQDILARFGQSSCNKRSNNPIQVAQGLIGLVIKGKTEWTANPGIRPDAFNEGKEFRLEALETSECGLRILQ